MGQGSSARSDLRDCGLSVLKALLRIGDRIPETHGERELPRDSATQALRSCTGLGGRVSQTATGRDWRDCDVNPTSGDVSPSPDFETTATTPKVQQL